MDTQSKDIIPRQSEYQLLISNISALINNARNQIAQEVSTTMVETYWYIGQYIVEYEQGGEARAKYGKRLLKQLSQDLTQQLGKGFGISNLVYIRKLYTTFPIIGTLSHKLSWGHYRP